MDEANDGITVNIQGKLVYVNPKFCQMVDFRENELLGKSVLDLTAPDYVEIVQDRTARRQEGQKVPSQYQVELIRNDGSIFPVEFNVSMIEYEGENASLSVIRDISAQKGLENALIESTERLEALHVNTFALGEVESIPELLSTTYDAIRSVLGYDNVTIGLCESNNVSFPFFRGELLDEPIILSLDGPSITRRTIESRQTQNVKDVAMDPDFINRYDEQVPSLLSELVVPLVADNEVLGVLNVGTENLGGFTDAEVRLFEILGIHVSLDLIRIKQYEQLDEQNVKLMELDDLKSRFIVTATHELRTPVTSILGFVDFMIQDESFNLSDDATDNLKIVLRNAHRLSTLTNDLLDLQRIQTGRLEIYPKEFDLVNLVNQVVEELSPLLQEKKQRLLLDTPESLNILGDENRISQLLINLLRNANKFTPEDGEISVSVEVIGDHVQVRIRDSGIGMDPGDMDRLFKPFPGINHGVNVTSSGLGLSICKGIVELHGGKIWAESEGLGLGSTFSFKIPIVG